MNRLFYQQFFRVDVLQTKRPNVPRRSQGMAYLTRSMVFVLALWLFCSGNGHAQRAGGPFERLAGQWAGSGTIDLSNGTREPIKCRASYDLLAEQHRLQLNIRCASDSYNFDLFSSVVLAGHTVSGSWSESTRSVAGTISGTAEGDRVQVHAESAGFNANLSLVTHGDRQTVSINTPDPKAGIKGATISLRRRG
jgi:hypothetical protein